LASGELAVERAASAIRAAEAQARESQSRARVGHWPMRAATDNCARKVFVSQEAADTRLHEANAASAAADAAGAQVAAARRDRERAQADVAGTASCARRCGS
jgi:hypothetical protein